MSGPSGRNEPADVVALAPNPPSVTWRAHVRREMRWLGPPVIRATWHDDLGAWLAVEGLHRLAVAAEDGVGIRIVPVEPEQIAEHDSLGVLPSPAPVAQILAEIASWREHVPYHFPMDRVSLAPRTDSETE